MACSEGGYLYDYVGRPGCDRWKGYRRTMVRRLPLRSSSSARMDAKLALTKRSWPPRLGVAARTKPLPFRRRRDRCRSRPAHGGRVVVICQPRTHRPYVQLVVVAVGVAPYSDSGILLCASCCIRQAERRRGNRYEGLTNLVWWPKPPETSGWVRLLRYGNRGTWRSLHATRRRLRPRT